VLRARLRFILQTLLATVACALVVSLLWPKTYKATTNLVLNYKGVDPVSGLTMSPQLMPGYVATQIDIILSKNVALKVVDALRLADNPSFVQQFEADGAGDIRQWIADQLQRRVRVTPSRESSVMEISYKARDPAFAAEVANAFASQYLLTSVQLNTDPLKKVSAYFTAQIRALREDLEQAQTRLSMYQQQKGIVDTDNRLDVESARLNELSSQLVLVQAQRIDASSRREEAQATGGREAPEVISNLLIQNLKASLAQAEAELASITEKFQDQHPLYQAAKAEVEKLRTELAANIKATSGSISSNARAFEQRERDLRAAVAEQKARVLELNRARDQLSVLAKDVESARRAHDNAVQRFNQTSLEGHANLPDVSVLNRAVVPTEPWFPRLPLNIAIAVFLGLVIGTGSALTIEFFRRRVRSAADLADALQAPVLAAFTWSSALAEDSDKRRGHGLRLLSGR
jgi:chain length determinant protein EpsF